MAPLADSNGITGWRPVNYANTVRATVVSDGNAHAGGRLLRAGGGTIRVEFYLESPGHSLDIDSVVLV